MDSLILEGVVQLLDRSLRGRSLLRWDRLAEGEYLLRFATAACDNLKISLRPLEPALYRLPHRATPRASSSDSFSGIAARELEGTTLIKIDRRGCDRVVELDWERPDGTRRRLVVELIGKSANLLLVDGADRVLAFARKMASAFRAPEVGRAYQPPVPRPGFEGATLDPDRAEAMVRHFAPQAAPLEAVSGFLMGISPPLGADFPHRKGVLQDPVEELQRILRAAQSGNLKPVLYTPLSPEEMLLRPEVSPHPPVLAPLPLAKPPAPVATHFQDCEEACRLTARLLEARHRSQQLRERISGALHREEARLKRLLTKLQREFEESAQAEIHQRYGDLILACPAAKVEGEAIVVQDLYAPEGGELRVPADPALSPRGNAEKHYARARKLRRGAQKIRERMASAASEQGAVAIWRGRLQGVVTLPDLSELESALIGARLLRPARGELPRRQRPAGESDPGIRKYRTEDGFVILVGKTSRDNDRLTFQEASSHDFWFHAADRSGAHVVVRNPSRLKELPRSVVLSAARIAAHFSRARGKGKVKVHYTLRKHVRKGKGFVPGLVTIRNHRTLEVEPGIPGEPERDG